jgi:hypothetical protein
MKMKEQAKSLRAELKKLNFSNKQISVVSDYSRILVQIKDQEIDIKDIENIAKKYESIGRDEFGGILSGGNDYVFVQYY